MGATLVAAGDERCSCSVQFLERLQNILAASDLRRTAAWADQDATQSCDDRLPWQFSFQKLGGLARCRIPEKSICRCALRKTSLMHEQDFIAEAPCLPEVVRDHHDLGAAGVHRDNTLLDFEGSPGIKTRGWLGE